ncbi:MAG: NUDIX domain-containing protein [Clostridia bacterium]|nr:NUDIX domain-containing protein [Clostridia bacterium]
MTDLTFKTKDGTFNYRVCAVMIHDSKILAMRDSGISHYYLPGGRVRINETAENALLRELKEELDIDITAEMIRPLWLAQGFFRLDNSGEQYHELALYFLVDISKTDLSARGESFILNEGEKSHRFDWLKFEELETKYFYPLFLKKEIFHLPESLKMITIYE